MTKTSFFFQKESLQKFLKQNSRGLLKLLFSVTSLIIFNLALILIFEKGFNVHIISNQNVFLFNLAASTLKTGLGNTIDFYYQFENTSPLYFGYFVLHSLPFLFFNDFLIHYVIVINFKLLITASIFYIYLSINKKEKPITFLIAYLFFFLLFSFNFNHVYLDCFYLIPLFDLLFEKKKQSTLSTFLTYLLFAYCLFVLNACMHIVILYLICRLAFQVFSKKRTLNSALQYVPALILYSISLFIPLLSWYSLSSLELIESTTHHILSNEKSILFILIPVLLLLAITKIIKSKRRPFVIALVIIFGIVLCVSFFNSTINNIIYINNFPSVKSGLLVPFLFVFSTSICVEDFKIFENKIISILWFGLSVLPLVATLFFDWTITLKIIFIALYLISIIAFYVSVEMKSDIPKKPIHNILTSLLLIGSTSLLCLYAVGFSNKSDTNSVTRININDGYRSIINSRNLSKTTNYNKINSMSDCYDGIQNKKTTSFLKQFGLDIKNGAYSTESILSILNVKYYYSDFNDGIYYFNKQPEQDAQDKCAENTRAFPIVFFANDKLASFDNNEGWKSQLDFQNSFFKALSGVDKDVLKETDYKKIDSNILQVQNSTNNKYFYISSNLKDVQLEMNNFKYNVIGGCIYKISNGDSTLTFNYSLDDVDITVFEEDMSVFDQHISALPDFGLLKLKKSGISSYEIVDTDLQHHGVWYVNDFSCVVFNLYNNGCYSITHAKEKTTNLNLLGFLSFTFKPGVHHTDILYSMAGGKAAFTISMIGLAFLGIYFIENNYFYAKLKKEKND